MQNRASDLRRVRNPNSFCLIPWAAGIKAAPHDPATIRVPRSPSPMNKPQTVSSGSSASPSEAPVQFWQVTSEAARDASRRCERQRSIIPAASSFSARIRFAGFRAERREISRHAVHALRSGQTQALPALGEWAGPPRAKRTARLSQKKLNMMRELSASRAFMGALGQHCGTVSFSSLFSTDAGPVRFRPRPPGDSALSPFYNDSSNGKKGPPRLRGDEYAAKS